MHASDFLRLAPSASTAKTEDEMTNLVAAIRSVIRNSGTRQNFCIVSTSDEGLRGQISVLVCAHFAVVVSSLNEQKPSLRGD